MSEARYIQDQMDQRANAEAQPCDCGFRSCYECRLHVDDDQPEEHESATEEIFENAQFEDAEDRYLDSTYEDQFEISYGGDE